MLKRDMNIADYDPEYTLPFRKRRFVKKNILNLLLQKTTPARV